MPSKEKLDISVIIPFKDKAKMTADCVKSFLRYGPKVTEILLVSNNSSDDELNKLREFLDINDLSLKLLVYNYPFNYQKINNWAVKHSKGSCVLFLNNDTELVSESQGLLEKMHDMAQKKNVGMVGCLLLYGDKRTIQHAGVFLKPRLQADHIYVGQSLKQLLRTGVTEKFPYLITEDRQLTAVTGAVQIVQKKKFDSVKGFDERFIICGGDVDLCIRLSEAGYQTWFVGGPKHIIHKESQSRSHKPIPFSDFSYSYRSYLRSFDLSVGDPYVPEITKGMI